MLGETLGSYRITAKIAEGGMGAVFAAEHTLLGRAAAVKVLHPELSLRRDMVERFFNEARATTAIHHPGIVEVFDFGFDAHGRAFIVMELLQGEPLSQRMRRGGVPVELAVSIVRRVAQAVGAAHAKGIVHRDLKPDNVFLVNDADVAYGLRPKVLDFGIAKLATNDHSQLRTRTGAVMGTPTYMSPEQCRGSGVVDHRADLYAIGCILYELIAGRPPFVAEGFGEMIAAHMTTPPLPLGAYVPTIATVLEQVVMRCLAKSPDDRFASTGDLVAALDAVVGIASHTPVPPPGSWSTPSQVPPITAAPPPTTLGGAAAQTMGTASGAGAPRGKAWGWIAAAGLLAAGAAVAAIVVLGGGTEPTSAPAPAPAVQAPPVEAKPAPPPPPPVEVKPPPVEPKPEDVTPEEVVQPDVVPPDEAKPEEPKPKRKRPRREPKPSTLETDL